MGVIAAVALKVFIEVAVIRSAYREPGEDAGGGDGGEIWCNLCVALGTSCARGRRSVRNN